jgi:preprotein translocase subunit SecA
MASKDVASTITDMRHETIEAMAGRCLPENALPDQWETDTVHEECLRIFNLDLPVKDWAKEEGIGAAEITERISQAVDAKMAQKAAHYGADVMRSVEKSLLLQILDQNWKEHLLQLEHLRQGINLRAYAQRDPVNEYKREAFELFSGMLIELREAVTRVLAHVELRIQRGEDEAAPAETPLPPPRPRPLAKAGSSRPSRISPPAGCNSWRRLSSGRWMRSSTWQRTLVTVSRSAPSMVSNSSKASRLYSLSGSRWA